MKYTFKFQCMNYREVSVEYAEGGDRNKALDIAFDMVGEREGNHLYIPGIEVEIRDLDGSDWTRT